MEHGVWSTEHVLQEGIKQEPSAATRALALASLCR